MVVAVLAAFALLYPRSADAQTGQVSIEARPGVTLPTGDLSDAGAGAGLSLGADLMYTFVPALTAYVGLSRDAFSCDDDQPCSEDINSNGVQGGLKLLFAREGTALPWARAGVMGQRFEVGDSDTDMQLGFEAGAGVDIDVSPSFALVPAVGFRTYGADLDNGSDIDARWFNLTLGGHIHF
jgi:opacity protein-like surface antigen